MKFLSVENMLKIAELKTQLQPHQQRVVDKLKNQSGLVVAHGMGSGKTLASLAVMDNLGMKANVVTPAALKNNYKKEYDKHTINAPSIHQEGLENIARKGGIPNVEAQKNPLLIVDEAHNIRDPSTKANAAIKKINNKAEKSLFLTGTPMYNHPSDISTLVNMAAREKLLPENKVDFENKYVYNKEVKPSFLQGLQGIKPGTVPVLNKFQKDNLQQILNKWVDYQPSSKENFPSVTEEDIKVPMTKSQLALYDAIIGQAPPWLAAKIKAGLPPDKKESRDLNAFATAARQISNSTAPFIQEGKGTPEAPKIQRAFEELQKHFAENPQAKAVIYSNYIDAGLNPYKALMDEAKIPYGEFTGRVDQNTRNQMIQDYNANKLKALFLSSAGGAGLDLKATSLMQLLDPHFNASKIDQAQGRAIRFGSHAELPEEQRKVHVQRFLATRPEVGMIERLGLAKPGGAIDEYLTGLSKYKSDLSRQFEELMQQPEAQKVASNTEALAKAEKIKEELKKRFNVTPFLSGSLYLGTNVPGKHDFDFNLHIDSKAKFDKLQDKFEKLFKPSDYNSGGKDHYIYHTSIKGEDVDLALTYGQKGKVYQDSLRAAKSNLTPEKKEEIIKQKMKLHNAWFFKEKRTKDFKRRLDEELGIKRIQRSTLKLAEHYNRKDIYGHRTNNLEGIIEHGLLSAHDAHKKGLLKSFEAGNNTIDAIFKGREKETETPTKLKSQIYLTPGLMPSSAAYGPYGVLTRKRQVEQSKYLNTIPGEVTTSKVKGKLTFVVPDEELQHWQDKYKSHVFMAESRVPDSKRLPEKDYSEILKRLIAIPKFRHETKDINEKIAKISDDVEKFLNNRDYGLLMKKLPSQKFQTSLAAKIEDPLLKAFISNNGKHAIAFKKNKGTHHQIKSSSQPAKSYTVIDHGNSWTCNCQDYLYKKAPRNGECKHITQAKGLDKTASAYVSHFMQSNQQNCSAASMKMALDYYGVNKTEDECVNLIGVHSKGAENDQIASAIEKCGLKCINKELTPEEVKEFLDMNCPIIIDGKSYNYPGKFHYTVLSDLDLEKDVAVIFDPNYDKKIRTLTLKELDEIWHSKQMYKPHKPLVRQGIVVIGHEKMASSPICREG